MRRRTVTALTIALLLAALVIVMLLGAHPAPAAQTQPSTLSSSGQDSTSYSVKVPALGQTQLCTLSSGQCSITFDLNTGDQVSGSISIKGGSAGGTKFWVTDPTGVNIYKAEKVSGAASFLFSASGAGVYILHFDSHLTPSSTELVTLTYYVMPLDDC